MDIFLGHHKIGLYLGVRSSELLAKLELEDLGLIFREKGFAGLGMWSVLVVQSEQHVIYRLMAGGGGGGGQGGPS